jgi:polysaccharide export outer membrane protein
MSTPDNLTSQLYGPEKAVDSKASKSNPSFASNACPAAGTTNFMMPPTPAKGRIRGHRPPPMRYSAGDRFNLVVYGNPEMSGDYVINADGTVMLPFAGPVNAVGLTNAELTSRIEGAFVRGGIFLPGGVKLAVRTVLFAPVNVTVAGAVFFPGRHTIGGIKDSDKLDRMMTKFGDNPLERFVPAALRAAGGIRPDADISRVLVHRHGKTMTLDWRGAFTGAPVDDLPLIDGDHVQVEEAGCFQSALIRPSQITPPGIRISFSNLASPVYSNAGSLQVSQSVPYGSRLLQGLIQANCVGGSYTTNAHRYAVLITRNPKTQQTEVIQRSIEELVRSAARDAINPFLMPDDAIACYEGSMGEFREVLNLLQAAVLPANTLSLNFSRL